MRRATVEQISIFGGLVGTPSRVDNSSNLVANMLRFAKVGEIVLNLAGDIMSMRGLA